MVNITEKIKEYVLWLGHWSNMLIEQDRGGDAEDTE